MSKQSREAELKRNDPKVSKRPSPRGDGNGLVSTDLEPSYREPDPDPRSLIGPLFYEAQPDRYLGDDLARRSAHRGWVSQKDYSYGG